MSNPVLVLVVPCSYCNSQVRVTDMTARDIVEEGQAPVNCHRCGKWFTASLPTETTPPAAPPSRKGDSKSVVPPFKALPLSSDPHFGWFGEELRPPHDHPHFRPRQPGWQRWLQNQQKTLVGLLVLLMAAIVFLWPNPARPTPNPPRLGEPSTPPLIPVVFARKSIPLGTMIDRSTGLEGFEVRAMENPPAGSLRAVDELFGYYTMRNLRSGEAILESDLSRSPPPAALLPMVVVKKPLPSRKLIDGRTASECFELRTSTTRPEGVIRTIEELVGKFTQRDFELSETVLESMIGEQPPSVTVIFAKKEVPTNLQVDRKFFDEYLATRQEPEAPPGTVTKFEEISGKYFVVSVKPNQIVKSSDVDANPSIRIRTVDVVRPTGVTRYFYEDRGNGDSQLIRTEIVSEPKERN
jgi:flagella basal body P-ring formation protein FlgA